MAIIPTAKKDFNKMTTLEQEREKRRLRGETEELLDAMGDESDKKAVKVVQEYVKEQKSLEQEQREMDVAQLKHFSNSRQAYQRYLIVVLHRFVKDEDIPKKYPLYVDSTDQGIVLGIAGTEYLAAFKTSGMPYYDIHACKILAVKLGNTVARLEGNFRTTDGGILVANEEEFKLAVRNSKLNHGRTS